MGKHKNKKMNDEKKEKMKKDEKEKLEKKDINKENSNEENREKQETKSLEKKISELEEDKKRLSDLLQRKVAEFENYKRRTENDINNIYKYAAEPFIRKVLAVFDDLGRSVSHADENGGDSKSFSDGVKMVYENFKKLLEEEGVKKIDAVGKEFDFNFHEALMRQESDEVEPNTVLHEVEPGYTYKDKVLKHTKVIVSQEKEEPKEKETENSEG
jgi:molecular chaperone GrpE